MHIQAINLGKRLAVTNENEAVDIRAMFDIKGKETTECGRVVSALAGPSVTGNWFAISIDHETVSLH